MQSISHHAVRTLLIHEQRSTWDALTLWLRDPGGPLDAPMRLHALSDLREAGRRLDSGHYDLALLDLSRRGMHPLDVYATLRAHGQHVPIVALAPDESIGIQAVMSGAYDYLVVDSLDGVILRRVIRSVLERRRLERALDSVDHHDALTGLLNEGGFIAQAKPQMEQTWRGKGTWILSGDVDGLRRINERHGFSAGNEALTAIARAVRASVRGSDVVARVGGDEFQMMLVNAGEQAATAVASRIQRKLADWANDFGSGSVVSLTIGTARCEPKEGYSLEELMRIAGEDLAGIKRKRVAG
jgi:diguanylate cyclase (GGDEF)-like protein